MMTAQVLANSRLGRQHKGCGFYLMELRQHVAETTSRREKLLINDWAAPKIQFVPILQCPPRIGPE